MDLTGMKKLSISGIALKKLLIGGVQAWKGGHTNLIDTATTEAGGTEIYDTDGYKDGVRWSSSGGAISSSAYLQGRVSGWIKLETNKKYYVKNFGVSNTTGYVNGIYIVLSKEDGSIKTESTGRTNDSYILTFMKWTVESEKELVTFEVTNSDYAYFRISGYNRDLATNVLFDTPIITCEEEITD